MKTIISIRLTRGTSRQYRVAIIADSVADENRACRFVRNECLEQLGSELSSLTSAQVSVVAERLRKHGFDVDAHDGFEAC